MTRRRGSRPQRAPAEHPQRQHGLGRPALREHEGDEHRRRDDEDHDALGRGPRPGTPPSSSPRTAGAGRREQRRPGHVEPVPGPGHLLLEPPRSMNMAAAPIGRLTKKIHRHGSSRRRRRPASGRSPRSAPDAGEVALHLRPLPHRVDVADDRHADRLDRAGAEPLQATRRRSAPACSTPRRRAPSRAGTPPMPRTSAACARTGRRACRRRGTVTACAEQVDREQPRELPEAAEVVDDRGHRGGDDRLSSATSPVESITASRTGPRSERKPFFEPEGTTLVTAGSSSEESGRTASP